MQKAILQIILLISLISCSEKNNKSATKEENMLQNSINDSKTIERYFPKNIEIETRDTIIKDGNFKISITRTSLKTAVIKTTFDQDNKYIDKYRDNKIHLTITQGTAVVIDTVFRKELFTNLEESFIKVANLYNYRFIKSEHGKFVFLATIIKPETDIDFNFYHYFDIKLKLLKGT